MSGFWSFLTGIIFMFVFKMGIWGFILGLFAGPFIYRFFNSLAPIRSGKVDPDLYLVITFEVLGHLSKAKGVITKDDINIATQFMDQLQLQGSARQLAQDSFNRGKSKDYPLRARLRELYVSYRHRRNVLNIFCEQLIQAALSDGHLHDNEQHILFIVAEEFRIPKAQMAMYIQMMMGSFHFHDQQSSRERRYQYQQYNQSYQQHSSQQSRGPTIDDAYRVLGVNASDDVTTIKRAYRKLMNEHHPDKLVSKGLPKEMLEAAKQRAQEIQAAYDLIKSKRGFK